MQHGLQLRGKPRARTGCIIGQRNIVGQQGQAAQTDKTFGVAGGKGADKRRSRNRAAKRLVKRRRWDNRRVAGGTLSCRDIVRGPDYVMWVVPEEVAAAAGPAALERALDEGLVARR